MSVTARFEADFASFQTAVDQSVVKLRSFETGAGKVESALSRMTDGLSGRKLIQDATLMAEAVDRIGGTSKLTSAELERLGGTATQAVTKMKALGIEVPPALQTLADATKQHPPLLERLRDVLGPIGPAFAAAFAAGAAYLSVDALKSAISGTIAFASHIDDLTHESGLSSDALQALSAKGGEVGLTMDTISEIAAKMSSRIAGNDDSAHAAIGKLGLSFKELKASTIDQQLLTTAEAISRVGDASLQANLSQELYGKAGLKLLGILRDNAGGFDDLIKRMKDAGLVIGEDTVKRLDAQGDAWTRLGTRVRVVSANVLDFLTDDSEYQKSLAKTYELLGKNADGTEKVATDIDLHTGALTKNVTAADLVANRLHQLTNEALAPLSQAQRLQIDQLTSWGENEKDVAALVGTTTAAVHLQVQAHNDNKTAIAKAAEEAKHAAEVEAQAVLETSKLWDEYFALRVEHGGTATDKQIADIDRWYADAVAKAEKAGTDTKEFYDALEALSHEKTDSVLLDWAAIRGNAISSLQDTADKAESTFEYMASHSSDFRRDVIDHFHAIAIEAQQTANGWGEAFQANFAKTLAAADAVQKKFMSLEKSAEQIANLALGGSKTYDLSTAEGMAEFQRLNPAAAVNAPADYFKNHTIQDAIAAGFIDLYAGYRANGGPVSAGMPYVVGEKRPEIFVPSTAGTILPNVGSGAGVVIHNAIYVTQPLGTPLAIGQAVSHSMESLLRSQGVRLPVGT